MLKQRGYEGTGSMSLDRPVGKHHLSTFGIVIALGVCLTAVTGCGSDSASDVVAPSMSNGSASQSRGTDDGATNRRDLDAAQVAALTARGNELFSLISSVSTKEMAEGYMDTDPAETGYDSCKSAWQTALVEGHVQPDTAAKALSSACGVTQDWLNVASDATRGPTPHLSRPPSPRGMT